MDVMDQGHGHCAVQPVEEPHGSIVMMRTNAESITGLR